MAGYFGEYPETYEDSLEALQDNSVISKTLYQQLKGLGGFRNILVHAYLGIDIDLVLNNYQKGFKIFPLFAQEILAWLDAHANA